MADDETGKGKDDAPEAQPASPEPAAGTETVDAEIVGEERADAPEAEEVTASDEPVAAAPTEAPKKKGKGGLIVFLLLLLALAAAAFFLFRDRLFGLEETETGETEVVERTPGVVVSEEPFPGNELDEEPRRPVRAEAAPGTREAAQEADAARAAAAATADESEADVAEAAQDDAAADDADTTVNALRARAAEQARARREAREAERRAEASVEDDAEETAQADDADALGFVSPDGDSDMARAVREARAAQARIRAQDQAARRAAAQGGAADTSSDARADDPNALSGFADDGQAASDDAGDEAEDAADSLRERIARLEDEQDDAADTDERADDPQDRDARDRAERRAPQPARPSGRVSPLGGEDADSPVNVFADEEAEGDEQAVRGQPVRPRPPVIETQPPAPVPALPDDVATEAELEERLGVVEADLREALRQDLRAEVREDVLAEASQRIDAAIQQTEREVASLREQLSEQEERSDQRIAQLRDRLEVLQDRDASASTRGVLVLALSNLRGQLDAGAPFERQLDDVERLAPNVTTLRSARRFAGTGLPTDADLREAFRDAEREALRAEAGVEAEGVFARMWANIRGLFVVRDIGAVEGEDTNAVISRARDKLTRGEVLGAVRELDALEGAAAEAFAPFVEEARAKAETRLQIRRLERAVLDADANGG